MLSKSQIAINRLMSKAHATHEETRVPRVHEMHVMQSYDICVFPSEIKVGLWYDPISCEFVNYMPLRVLKANAQAIHGYHEIFSLDTCFSE